MTNGSLPLKGIKVLDLSRVLAGPLCTMTLGDLGADVLKVERPGSGDDTRGWGPPFAENGLSAYYISVNRNKLSIAIDFSSTSDVRKLLELASHADVIVENYMTGVLARYGIDSDSILALNESLIWCTISGFGPESKRPGYDFVVQAESGWMAITGTDEHTPTKAGVAFADVIAGKDACIAILAGLAGRARRPSAADRKLDVSLLGSATAALVNVAQNSLVTGAEARRWGNAHANLVPYELFHARDRALVIAVGTDAQWHAAAKVLGLDAMAVNPELKTNAGRLANRSSVVSAVAEALAQDTASAWITKLERAGVPCGEVRSVLDALRSVNASAGYGVEPAAGGSVRRLPPQLDEHGFAIRKYGWSAFDHVPILP